MELNGNEYGDFIVTDKDYVYTLVLIKDSKIVCYSTGYQGSKDRRYSIKEVSVN